MDHSSEERKSNKSELAREGTDKRKGADMDCHLVFQIFFTMGQKSYNT